MKNPRARHLLIGCFGLFCALIGAFARFPDAFPGGAILMQRLRGQATVADRVAQFGGAVHARWQPHFAKAQVAYPPSQLILVVFKREKQLQVYARDAGQPPRWIRTLPILGLSGKLGPKLRFGDMQVPEGFYRVQSLNPNSSFPLALRVDYPNAADRARAAAENRTELGGDIMIHGSNASIGCLAMGDEGAEDLFVLAAQVAIEHIELILSPLDFRTGDVPRDETRPAWVNGLYADLKKALLALPK